ncbi:hypothetical protein CHARACLAT_009527 [Characodon lateralis]|uniref:Uncharacterized protein n=1 Tax=Characodon lateralis TaxID=208331 RepID=A0ABU7DJ33_9TELE|nr:hypothetical protein [Characodon lateralis]
MEQWRTFPGVADLPGLPQEVPGKSPEQLKPSRPQLRLPGPDSKKVLGLIPGRGSFCMEIACSPRACMGSHRRIRTAEPRTEPASLRTATQNNR